MNYRNMVSAVLLLALPGVGHAFTIIVEEKTAVNSCLGPNATCIAQILGAPGDTKEFAFDVSTAKPLGPAGKVDTVLKDVSFELPQKPGDKVGYFVTFKKGESAGEKIYILIVNLVPKPGSLEALGKKQDIRMYRRFKEETARMWTEVGNFDPPKEFIGKIGNTTVTLKPDGIVIWTNPVTKKDTIFFPAKKILKEPMPPEKAVA